MAVTDVPTQTHALTDLLEAIKARTATVLSSVPCTAEELGAYDAVLVATAHSQFMDPSLYAKAKLVIDTRNIVPQSVSRALVRA
jgi:UDP-N-acetyl-D-mannosaminuronate dehydrogenase